MNFLTLKDLGSNLIKEVIDKALVMKANPEQYKDEMRDKTLLMIFEKPSLRTRISFEAGMTKMGGHGIYYDVKTSPLGKGETIGDTAACAGRYCDIIMARLFDHEDIIELADNSRVPVINALTNFSHPCQIMADLMTIKEKKGKFKGLKVTFLGDGFNNVTHSLLYGCSMAGINISVGSPKEHMPGKDVVEEAKEYALKSGSKVEVFNDAKLAVKDADVVYTDTWMSYHIKDEEKEKRVKLFMPFQVNSELMQHAKKDAIFMHCLPGYRGFEMTADIIDGKQSVVFDQAENRLWAQNALILKLLGKF